MTFRQSMGFRAAIVRLRDDYVAEGIHPEQINAGFCADFATVLWESFREVKILGDDDLDPTREYTHTVMLFEGRYYDAERVDGVDDWRDLPIFARQLIELAELRKGNHANDANPH